MYFSKLFLAAALALVATTSSKPVSTSRHAVKTRDTEKVMAATDHLPDPAPRSIRRRGNMDRDHFVGGDGTYERPFNAHQPPYFPSPDSADDGYMDTEREGPWNVHWHGPGDGSEQNPYRLPDPPHFSRASSSPPANGAGQPTRAVQQEAAGDKAESSSESNGSQTTEDVPLRSKKWTTHFRKLKEHWKKMFSRLGNKKKHERHEPSQGASGDNPQGK